jgi:outer membrane protein TolC
VRLRLLIPLLVVSAPLNASAEARRLSIEDVLQMALASHPRLAAARSRAEGARDLQASARGRLLPTIAVSEEYQRYDSPFEVAFAIPGGMSFPPLLAREQTTNTFVAAASQPVVGLLRRSEDYKAQARNADAAEAGVRVAEAGTREALQVEYLRMFESKAMEDIAHASENELGEQVTVTGARVKAGVLNNSDLLRVQAAQANAQQQAIAARTQVTVARATLLGAIGLSPADRTVEFVEPTALLAGDKPPTASPETAQARRPEVAQASFGAEAAQHEARARGFAMLPEVGLEGAYLRVDGQVFAPKNSAFVGIKAEWPIWEWGASENARRAAVANAEAARSEVETQRRQVAVEVTARDAQLEAASNAVAVADQAIASAQEAYRVTEAQVKAGAATTTDLLDSQAALTQARLNLARARYEQAIARVQLEHAMGGP